jgi:hypothetical protein
MFLDLQYEGDVKWRSIYYEGFNYGLNLWSGLLF